jgi:hypothetical protein
LQPKAYGIHTWYSPYYDLGPHGELIFRPVENRAFSDLRSFLELHSLLSYYVERTWAGTDVPLYKWKGLPFWMGLYGDPPDAEWEQAWRVTGRMMSWLNQTVENDGIKLIYLMHPGFNEIDPEWKELVARTYGKSVAELPPLRPEQINTRLKEIAAQNALTLDFLGLYFQAYRDAHDLKSPYFSFTCEKHFSALGNEVLAEAIVQKLKEHGLLPPLGGGSPAPPSQ